MNQTTLTAETSDTAVTVISVVIAAYKGEKYIGEQLKSLFSQTMPPDEILIGDDSPDDATEKAIDAIRAEAPEKIKIHYIRNTRQLGVLMNFSALAEMAKGDYIFFCDQDDVWLDHKIETLVNALEQNPDCDLAACDSMRVTADLKPLERLVNQKYVTDSKTLMFRRIWNFSYSFPGHNIVMRNRKTGMLPFPADFNAYHDLWMLLYCGIQNRMIYLNQMLVLYRIHDSNASKPLESGYQSKSFARIRELRQNTWSDLEVTLNNSLKYRELLFARINPSQIPATNLAYVNGLISFYQWRLENYKRRSRIVRLFRLLFHIPDYFKYSRGIRSIIRDILF